MPNGTVKHGSDGVFVLVALVPLYWRTIRVWKLLRDHKCDHVPRSFLIIQFSSNGWDDWEVRVISLGHEVATINIRIWLALHPCCKVHVWYEYWWSMRARVCNRRLPGRTSNWVSHSLDWIVRNYGLPWTINSVSYTLISWIVCNGYSPCFDSLV